MELYNEEAIRQAGQQTKQRLDNFTKTPTYNTATPTGNISVQGVSPARQMLGSTLSQAGSAAKAIGKSAPNVYFAGKEIYDTYQDVNVPGMTTTDKVARVGEGVGRLASAGVGARIGATFGAPLGGFGAPIGAGIGGIIGYAAPNIVNAGLNSMGDVAKFISNGKVGNALSAQLPSQRAESLRVQLAQPNKPLAPKTNTKAIAQTGAGQQATNTTTAPQVQPQAQTEVMPQVIYGMPARQNPNQFGAKPGFQPLDANATAQQLIMSALQDVKGIKNQANADTLGGAVAQKVANKQLETIAGAKARIADQLNGLAGSSINMRQGEQGIALGNVNIDQANQNLVQGGLNIVSTGQKLQMGQQEVERSNLLRQTLDNYINEKDATKREELASLALTLQGKEPRLPYDFKEVSDTATGAKSLYRINTRTGQAEIVGGGAPANIQEGAKATINGVPSIYSKDKGWQPAA